MGSMKINLFLSLSLSLLLLSCSQDKKSSEARAVKPTIYATYWENIASLEQKGMQRTAVKELNGILEISLAEQNYSQLFKALAHRSKFINQIDEHAEGEIIESFHQQIEKSSPPGTQLLQSALGELYTQYQEANRWRIQNRSTVADNEKRRLSLMSSEELNQKAEELYNKSLMKAEVSRDEPLKDYLMVLNFQPKGQAFIEHFSLYDFLVLRALQHYQQELYQDRLGDSHLNDSLLFIPASEFSKQNWEQLSLTPLANWLRLSGEVLSVQMKEKDEFSRLYFDLSRLDFAMSQVSDKQKAEMAYSRAMEDLIAQLKTDSLRDKARASQAQFIYHQRENVKDAISICEACENPKSYGSKACRELIENIKMPAHEFALEAAYPSEQAILFSFSYRNLQKAFFRLYRLADDHFLKEDRINHEVIEDLLQKKPLQSWSQELKSWNDHQSHSTELKMEGLKAGSYILIGSDGENFERSEENLSSALLSVSNIAYLKRYDASKGEHTLYLKDRSTGIALSGAMVKLYSRNFEQGGSQLKLLQVIEADSEGKVLLGSELKEGSYSFEVEHNGESLYSDQFLYLASRNNYQNKRKLLNFFSDRSLYRGGQTIYFKGIYHRIEGEKRELLKAEKCEVSLYDPRGEKLQTKVFTSNQMGSISGEFNLPEDALNGNYRLASQDGSFYFKVEAYRRPSLRIIFDSLKNSYQLGDSILISGRIESFTGMPVVQSELDYEVFEIKQGFPPHYLSSYYQPPQKTLIDQASFRMKDDRFEIKFKSRGRPMVESLDYQLKVHISSPLGENVEAEKNLKIHDQAIKIALNTKENLNVEELNDLPIKILDHSQRMLYRKGMVELWSLEKPEAVYIEKYWEKPDHQTLSKNEYNKHFPTYDYHSNSQLGDFPKKQLLSISAFKSGEALQTFGDLQEGPYLIKAYTVSEEGDTIAEERRFRLLKSDSKQAPFPEFFWSELKKTDLIEGEKIKLELSSSLSSLKLMFELEYKGKIVDSRMITLNSERKLIEIDSRGRVGKLNIHLAGIAEGRSILKTQTINIDPQKPPYEISLKTKRDYTQPKAKEEWSIGIKGLPKGENIELMASMHDHSLDELDSQRWTIPQKPGFPINYRWQLGRFFGLTHAYQFPSNSQRNPMLEMAQPPYLNWFGFRLGYGNNLRLAAVKGSFDDSGMVLNEKIDGIEVSQETSSDQEETSPKAADIRTDLRETVFFYPQLSNQGSDEINISFEMPDALTSWKFRALAHNEDLHFAELNHLLVSRKQLMVKAYFPRFFRAGDRCSLKLEVQNAGDSLISGKLGMRFFDAMSGREIDLLEVGAEQRFSLLTKDSYVHTFQFQSPDKPMMIKYQIYAKGENHSDIEEGYLQVFPSEILIAESFNFEVDAGGSRDLNYQRFKEKINEVNSTRLYKVEYTADPRWLAVYALPSMIRDEQDCPEMIFSSLYARALSSHTAKNIDGLEAFLNSYKGMQSPPSQLEENKDLHLTSYEASPWLKVGEEEALQRSRLRSLLDQNRQNDLIRTAIERLDQLQLDNGAWPWFKGMQANRYLSQYIAGGLAKIQQLDLLSESDEMRVEILLQGAYKYLDKEVEEHYQRLLKVGIKEGEDYLSPQMIHYLYLRSFDEQWNPNAASSFYLNELEDHWFNKNPMLKALMGLSLFQMNPNQSTILEIQSSLKDMAIRDSLGIHWKFSGNRPYWYESAIEAQAYLIEFYQKMSKNDPDLQKMKRWLLHQKKQQYWPGNKASSQACYALLAEDRPLSADLNGTSVVVGNEPLDGQKSTMPAYLSKSWEAAEIDKGLANIKIEQSSSSFGWGAAHWQYYEEMSEMKSHSKNGLSISSNYYSYDPEAEALMPIKGSLKVGDLVKQRMEIVVNYDLEYVYISEQPPAALESSEWQSGMRYEDGLSYYSNVKDSERQWYIEKLTKGRYVLESAYRVSQEGSFQGGICQLQCLYAPEFVAYDNAGSLEIKGR